MGSRKPVEYEKAAKSLVSPLICLVGVSVAGVGGVSGFIELDEQVGALCDGGLCRARAFAQIGCSFEQLRFGLGEFAFVAEDRTEIAADAGGVRMMLAETARINLDGAPQL